MFLPKCCFGVYSLFFAWFMFEWRIVCGCQRLMRGIWPAIEPRLTYITFLKMVCCIGHIKIEFVTEPRLLMTRFQLMVPAPAQKPLMSELQSGHRVVKKGSKQLILCISMKYKVTGLQKLCQPASLAVRKWRENEKMKRMNQEQ